MAAALSLCWAAGAAAQSAAPPTAAVTQSFTVLLDAAHGGADTGTTLAPQVLEKDLVLSLSIRLRSALTARGITVVTTREKDEDPAFETRSAEANHARAGACLVLHATASGSGVHLYTSSLAQQSPAEARTDGRLEPWSMAEAPFATQSLELASGISTSLQSAGIPFTLGRVRLQPLDSMRCPVVAVEIAPLHAMSANQKTEAKISDADYQQRVLEALAAALVQWRMEHPAGGAG